MIRRHRNVAEIYRSSTFPTAPLGEIFSAWHVVNEPGSTVLRTKFVGRVDPPERKSFIVFKLYYPLAYFLNPHSSVYSVDQTHSTHDPNAAAQKPNLIPSAEFKETFTQPNSEEEDELSILRTKPVSVDLQECKSFTVLRHPLINSLQAKGLS